MEPKVIARGEVAATLITPPARQASSPIDFLQISTSLGVIDDHHGGRSRKRDVRESVLKHVGVPKGTPIANVRQVTIISDTELARIGRAMGAPEPLPYGLLGENLVIKGIDSLTELPPGSLITFDVSQDSEDDYGYPTLAVWGKNNPCGVPHHNIVQYFATSHPAYRPFQPFIQAAIGLRGLVCFVYCFGIIRVGDAATVWEPHP